MFHSRLEKQMNQRFAAHSEIVFVLISKLAALEKFCEVEFVPEETQYKPGHYKSIKHKK